MDLSQPVGILNEIIYPKDYRTNFLRLIDNNQVMKFFSDHPVVYCMSVACQSEQELEMIFSEFQYRIKTTIFGPEVLFLNFDEIFKVQKEIRDGIPFKAYIPSLLTWATQLPGPPEPGDGRRRPSLACTHVTWLHEGEKYHKYYMFFASDGKFLEGSYFEEMQRLAIAAENAIINGKSKKPRNARRPLDTKLRHEVFKRDGYRCLECGLTNNKTTLHADHIIPVAQGGTDEISNLQTLCEACNLAKSDKCWKTQCNPQEDVSKGNTGVSNV